MKEITTKDLRESLTLLLPERKEDGQGGWRETWRNGPQLWASLWPLFGKSAFQTEDEGGPMASHLGYLKTLPPPHYRLIIRTGLRLPSKIAFLWHLHHQTKRLFVTTAPVPIQYNRFLSMIVIEGSHA